MKKLVVFILAIILTFGFCSCKNEDGTLSDSNSQEESNLLNLQDERLYLTSSSDSSKPLPSTKLSVEMPRIAKRNEPIIVKIGMGKDYYTEYNTKYHNYIETIFSFDAPGAIVNGNNDYYSLTFDINEEKYLCAQYGKPQYFIEIPLDFSSCEQATGEIAVELTSYISYSSGSLNGTETNGSRFHVDYTIEGNYICFSSN